jgi:hypothetical protein
VPADPADSAPLLSESRRRITGFALSLLALAGSAALLIAARYALGHRPGRDPGR